MLAASRESANPNGFALVCMLGLLGLRIFEATGANIEDLSEAHGHRVLRVHGQGDKIALVPLPPSVGRALERAITTRVNGPILRSRTGTRMDRHCATRRLRALAASARVSTARMHPHMLRPHLRHHHARRRCRPTRRSDRSPPRRSPHHHALRPSTQEPRPAPQTCSRTTWHSGPRQSRLCRPGVVLTAVRTCAR
jgi:integrase/recombinase XerD